MPGEAYGEEQLGLEGILGGEREREMRNIFAGGEMSVLGRHGRSVETTGQLYHNLL